MENPTFLRKYVPGFCAALAVIVFARLFLVDFFVTQGNSMAPTIPEGTVLLVNRAAYGFQNPFGGYLFRWGAVRSGDVIVFIAPDGRKAVKRCYATWGDRDKEFIAWAPGTLVALGDNPAESWDSRSYGPISENQVLGKVAGCR